MGVGPAIKGQIIPYAVRWYTGEAAPDDDDDDEDDEDDDDDDDDDEEDESNEESEEEEKPKRGKAKGKAKKPAGAGEKKEECKQRDRCVTRLPFVTLTRNSLMKVW